jgi:hypothetical protein
LVEADIFELATVRNALRRKQWPLDSEFVEFEYLPNSPTFAKLCCADSPDSPTLAKGHF